MLVHPYFLEKYIFWYENTKVIFNAERIPKRQNMYILVTSWFYFSRNLLLTLIEERGVIISDYWTLGICKGDSSEGKLWLSALQMSVYDTITLTKAARYAQQAETIHSMRFNPKESWQSVHIISGVDTIHHASPTVVQMRLPNGELATTDAEHASIFWPHFNRVFNNHRPIDCPVMDKINQRDIMEEWYQQFHHKVSKRQSTRTE